MWTKLPKNLFFAKYLISVAAAFNELVIKNKFAIYTIPMFCYILLSISLIWVHSMKDFYQALPQEMELTSPLFC